MVFSICRYYSTPVVAFVTPNFGSTEGGTVVRLDGAHFFNTDSIMCRFGNIVVPVKRFVSHAQVMESAKGACSYHSCSERMMERPSSRHSCSESLMERPS